AHPDRLRRGESPVQRGGGAGRGGSAALSPLLGAGRRRLESLRGGQAANRPTGYGRPAIGGRAPAGRVAGRALPLSPPLSLSDGGRVPGHEPAPDAPYRTAARPAARLRTRP